MPSRRSFRSAESAGMPVVDADNRAVGIVSWDDLLHRIETDTQRRTTRRSSWRRDTIASDCELARRYVIVVPDLRGYGDSSKPPAGADHANYAKRALALDQVETMAALGFERFAVAGHDRHRLARDHPERIERLALLDVVPTLYRFETIDQKAATASYHWFFLIQPGGLPERLIGAEPEFFLRHSLRDPAVFE